MLLLYFHIRFKFSFSLLGCLPSWGLHLQFFGVKISQLGFAVWSVIIITIRKRYRGFAEFSLTIYFTEALVSPEILFNWEEEWIAFLPHINNLLQLDLLLFPTEKGLPPYFVPPESIDLRVIAT